MLLIGGVGEDSWESLGLQGDPTSQCWISVGVSLKGLMQKLKLQYFGHLLGRTDSFEKTLERLKVGGEGDDRGWDGWMALLTQWTWVWVNSRSWWWTGKSGMLQSMGSQRVGHDWVIELMMMMQLGYLETIWFFQFLLLWSVRQDWSSTQCRANYSPLLKKQSSVYTVTQWIIRIFSLIIGNRHFS